MLKEIDKEGMNTLNLNLMKLLQSDKLQNVE